MPTPQCIAASAPNTQSFFNAYGKLKPNDVLLQTQSINGFAGQGINICGTSAACSAFNPNTPLFSQYAYTYAGDAGGGLPDNEYQTVARLDYNLSDKTQMYARYALQSLVNPPGVISNSPYQGFDSANTNFNNNALFSFTHAFSPNFVSQSKAVFNRLNNQQPFGAQPPVPTLYVNPTGSINLGQSSVVFPGYDPFTPGNGIPFGGLQNFVQLYEDLSWSHGKHQLRFGGSFEYLYKTFSLTEKFKLQIRAEAYNIFNHANLYVQGAGADVSSSNLYTGVPGLHRDRDRSPQSPACRQVHFLIQRALLHGRERTGPCA